MFAKNDKIIFHVDVNSAYLSWTAVKLLQYGSIHDIRKVPSVIAGDTENRHGIVLAASIPAKKLGIKTGDVLWEAKQKCRDVEVYAPDYDWYMKSSRSLVNMLYEYSPIIQRYSIDECFMDCSSYKENYLDIAKVLKDRICNELGFNCNIGISTNKLLAKMASDFKPKNSIHTLFKNEIEKKMWPLNVDELFMVGKATKSKLKKLNINTIGELANYDVNILKSVMHSHGQLIYDYANGIENSLVRSSNYLDVKGLGNSITIPYDVDNFEDAYRILLALTETTSMRLRENKSLCSVVTVSIKTDKFISYSHQKKLSHNTDSTIEIFEGIKSAFNECWKGENIRQLGVRVTKLCCNKYRQENLFDYKDAEKQIKLDAAIDNLRKRFGRDIIVRSVFINSGTNSYEGGTGSHSDYPMMSSTL